MRDGERPDSEAAAELAPRWAAEPAAAARRAIPTAAAATGHAPWVWLLPALTVVAVLLLYVLRSLLTPFVLAAVLAYLVAPVVERLQRHAGLPRGLAILVAYAGTLLVIAAFAVFVLPDLVAEMQRLAAGLPAYTARLEVRLAALRGGYGRLPLPPAMRAATDRALLQAEAAARASLDQALAGAVSVFGLIVPLLLAPVLAFYILCDLPLLRTRLSRLLPPAARQPVLLCLADLDAVIAGWIRGELLTAGAVGVLATLAVLVLRLRYAFTLGLVAGLGELIPYFGPVLGALPALAVAAGTGGFPAVVYTGLAFLAIQQIESVFLAPRIVGGSVGLHPLAVIAALLVGDQLGGLCGIILAVPAAGCARVLVRHGVRVLTAVRAPRRLT